MSKNFECLKLSFLIALSECLNFLLCLSSFQIAFKISMSSQIFLLNFTSNIIIAAKKWAADKILETNSW